MIPFNAALVGAYWERLRVRLSEQRRVAGREPPSEQPSEGLPGYLAESRVHLHPHRAPITATRPTGTQDTDIRAMRSRAMGTQATPDTPPTPVLRAMDTQVIQVSPAMDIRATRETPLTPVLRAMDTQATRDSQLTPPRVTDRQATRDTLPTPDPRPLRRQAARDSPPSPVVRAMDIRARRPILPTPVRVTVTKILSLAIPVIAR